MLNIQSCQTEIINTIKLLIYKENPSLLEKIDFDDDTLFLEPLLFFYFNQKVDFLLPDGLLPELIQGYFLNKYELNINHSFYKNEITYLPKLGYFKKNETTFSDPIYLIENTDIEVLKYSGNLLRNIFTDISGNLISDCDIILDITLFEKNIAYLTNAVTFIKENSNDHFQLIEKCCKKILLFKSEPTNTNSFASIKAHGIAFLNVYQDEYDEVFFIDDIAHQTGHIILTTLFYNRKTIFKINEEQDVEDILKLKDHRTIYILLHALYTYYTTFLCLDNCLKNNKFNKQQEKEAIGRIGFYLNKCYFDLNRFEKINLFYKGIDNVLTEDGKEIYNLITRKYLEISQKWQSTTNNFDYSNQPYNFTFKLFDKLNALERTQL
ncbi:hypothetical protein [Flavobacterium sp. KBS0721]|uniref:hypothetical protein n=1 Tax=Flavobacterium sp. KBS0721 TaxID=1179672 RepID=UPI00098E975C|nr:hypothetical protein [Flavobacterium sp. KBS0721]QDW19718.1 hypothetical protein B0M43_0006195 [Flavobacterium sp. KBS0721]